MSDEKKISFANLVKLVNKKFDDPVVMTMGDVIQVPSISTGSLLLDKCIGYGGVPLGRITELYGSPSSGKTTIALQIIANAQKNGMRCLFVDAEQSFDASYAKHLGVSDDPDKFALTQVSTAEDLMKISDYFIRSGLVGVVVIDSIAAMTTIAEMEGEYGDANIGQKARIIGQFIRRITPLAHKQNVSVIMINQERDAIGVMYGNPKTTPGGHAIKFHATLRISMKQSKALKEGTKEPYGQITLAKVEKNKLAAPAKKCAFEIHFGKGVILESEMVEIGLLAGLWTRKGSWYAINGENVANGSTKMTAYLQDLRKDDPKTFEKYLADCQTFVQGADHNVSFNENDDSDGDSNDVNGDGQ